MPRFSVIALLCALAAAMLVRSPAQALEEKQKAPALSATDISGKKIDLAALKGKVVIVDFWASWCGPCKVEMPVLERLYKTYKDRGLVVIGVSVDKERSNIVDFLKKLRVSFPIVHDADHGISGRFKPPKMPSSYVIDRQGIVRHVHEGFRKDPDEADLEAEVKALLGK